MIKKIQYIESEYLKYYNIKLIESVDNINKFKIFIKDNNISIDDIKLKVKQFIKKIETDEYWKNHYKFNFRNLMNLWSELTVKIKLKKHPIIENHKNSDMFELQGDGKYKYFRDKTGKWDKELTLEEVIFKLEIWRLDNKKEFVYENLKIRDVDAVLLIKLHVQEMIENKKELDYDFDYYVFYKQKKELLNKISKI